jgi:hypothetical protein
MGDIEEKVEQNKRKNIILRVKVALFLHFWGYSKREYPCPPTLLTKLIKLMLV